MLAICVKAYLEDGMRLEEHANELGRAEPPRRRPARRVALALGALLPLALAGTLHADHFRHREQTLLLAHAEAHSMIRHGDNRVITGVNPAGGAWIVIEKLENGAPAWQGWVQTVTWGSWTLSVERDLGEVRLNSNRDGIVAFAARHQRRDWLQCQTDTRSWPWKTVCSGTYTGPQPRPRAQPQPQPPPPPPQPRWSADPEVIAACDHAFITPANEQACLTAVAHARYNPRDVIGACDAAIVREEDALTCVRGASAATFDPSEAVRACDTGITTDAHTAACVAAAARFPSDPSATVRACDASMITDSDTVACVQRASGAR